MQQHATSPRHGTPHPPGPPPHCTLTKSPAAMAAGVVLGHSSKKLQTCCPPTPPKARHPPKHSYRHSCCWAQHPRAAAAGHNTHRQLLLGSSTYEQLLGQHAQSLLWQRPTHLAYRFPLRQSSLFKKAGHLHQANMRSGHTAAPMAALAGGLPRREPSYQMLPASQQHGPWLGLHLWHQRPRETSLHTQQSHTQQSTWQAVRGRDWPLPCK